MRDLVDFESFYWAMAPCSTSSTLTSGVFFAGVATLMLIRTFPTSLPPSNGLTWLVYLR